MYLGFICPISNTLCFVYFSPPLSPLLLLQTAPLLPRLWEHWDTQNLVELEIKYIILFSLPFSIYHLCSKCPLPFLHPFSAHQFYLVLILPTGFPCSPCNLIHHPLQWVQCWSRGDSEGWGPCWAEHSPWAEGQPSSHPGDPAGWVFEHTRGKANKEDADLVQYLLVKYFAIFTHLGNK